MHNRSPLSLPLQFADDKFFDLSCRPSRSQATGLMFMLLKSSKVSVLVRFYQHREGRARVHPFVGFELGQTKAAQRFT